jgi:RNA polymerase sigma-70 factor, ECF subfamily
MRTPTLSDDAAERFEAQRRRLLNHAYRMLGVYADAEDVVQEAYLRWEDALQRAEVRDDHAFLRATVTRLCLSRLRSARARREVYVGSWLPEPILDDVSSDPQAAATLADDVSFALLLALERLSPLERAAFLLHDALDVPFAEIAQTLGRSEVAVRRLASRAREHVREANVHRNRRTEDVTRLRDAFAAALRSEDLEGLQKLLTDDVVFVGDGGGKVPATMVPVAGLDKVSRLLVGFARKGAAHVRALIPATINAAPGFLIVGKEGLLQTMMLDVDGDRIRAIYATRNPDKLSAIAARLGELVPNAP